MRPADQPVGTNRPSTRKQPATQAGPTGQSTGIIRPTNRDFSAYVCTYQQGPTDQQTGANRATNRDQPDEQPVPIGHTPGTNRPPNMGQPGSQAEATGQITYIRMYKPTRTSQAAQTCNSSGIDRGQTNGIDRPAKRDQPDPQTGPAGQPTGTNRPTNWDQPANQPAPTGQPTGQP